MTRQVDPRPHQWVSPGRGKGTGCAVCGWAPTARHHRLGRLFRRATGTPLVRVIRPLRD